MFGSRQTFWSLQSLYPWVKTFWKLIKAEPSLFGSIFLSVCRAPRGSQISAKMWLFKASQCFLFPLTFAGMWIFPLTLYFEKSLPQLCSLLFLPDLLLVSVL